MHLDTSLNNALSAPLCSDPNFFAGRQAPPRSIPWGSSSKASAMRNVRQNHIGGSHERYFDICSYDSYNFNRISL